MKPPRTPRVISVTVDTVEALAKQLAKRLLGGEVLALIGPLGAGKTTFTKHLGKALMVQKRITSPTFVLMQSYRGRFPASKQRATLHHLDLYRITSPEELESLSLSEFWGKPGTVTAIEWADKFPEHLPPSTQYIYFSLKNT